MKDYTQIDIDYMQGILLTDSVEELQKILKGWAKEQGDKLIVRSQSCNFGQILENKINTLNGSFLGGYTAKPGKLTKAIICFPGATLEGLSRSDQLTRISLFTKITRLDLRKDTQSEFNSKEIKSLIENGNIAFKNTSKFYLQGNYNINNLEEQDYTLYFGAPSSDKRIRIYDTKYKHEYDFLRVELQLRREKANKIAQELINNFDKDINSTIDKLMAGEIQFKGDPIIWEKIWGKKTIDPIKITMSAKKKTIDKKMAWISKSVAPSLQILYEGLGEKDFIKYIKSLRKEELPEKDKLLILELKENRL